MQKIIYYWEAIIGQEALVSEYSEKLKRLLSGEYKSLSLDLKKLTGCRLYSIRLNDSDRLLFTLLTSSDGKTYLVLLEKIPNHDYQKSRFLKPNVLKQFLETQGEAILKQVQETDFKEIDVLPCAHAQDNDELSFLKVEYYKDTFIALNERQTSAVNCYNALPLIISGPPGAGKSCVALNILSQCSEQHAESNKPILLVTRNTHLKSNLAATFAATHPQMDPKQVHIRTYDELLAEIIRRDQFVGKEDFRQWLKQYVERQPFPANKVPSQATVYNEFGIIDICEANYLQLGANESLFTDAKERNWLLHAYQDYRHKHLADRINPDFYPVTERSRYTCIIADESQNFSPRQLQILIALANGQNCFCLDTNQATEDVQSKRAFLAKSFYQLGIPLQEKQLPIAYRCPEQVTRVINALLKTKYKVTGGKIDKQQYGLIELARTQARQGSVQWWNPELTSERKHVLNQLAGSVGFAIVTLPEFVAEVRTIVDTPLIFTPNQVGGLEYNTVFAYRVFDHEKFKEINKKLAAMSEEEEGKETINRPKNKDMTAMLDAPQFNEVFIAFSRACENLIICQADKHEIKYVLSPIRKEVSEATARAIAMPESSTADWEEHRRLQLASGNTEQAQMIQDKLEDAEQAEEIAVPIMCSSSNSSTLSPGILEVTSSLFKKAKERQSVNNLKKGAKKSPNNSNQLAPTQAAFTEMYSSNILPIAINMLGTRESFNNNFPRFLESDRLSDFCKLIRLFASSEERWLRFILFFGTYLDGCLQLDPSKHSEIPKSTLQSNLLKLQIILKDEKSKTFLNSSEKGKILLSLITAVLVQVKIGAAGRTNDFAVFFGLYLPLLYNTYTNNIKYDDFQTIRRVAIGNPSSWLLTYKPSQVVVEGRSRTMLHEAALYGDAIVAEVLCCYHTNIDQLTEDGCSALYLATMRGHLSVVEILLRRGAFPHHPTHPCKPLLVAALQATQSENHFRIFQSLLNSKVLKLFPIDCYTLFAAASNSNVKVLEALLSAGCNPQQLDPETNQNALFPVAESGCLLAVDILLKRDCRPNHSDINGCIPLALAIAKGRIEMVDIFLPDFEMSHLVKFKFTRIGLRKLGAMCPNVYSVEVEKRIVSKYALGGFIWLTPLELASELKQEAVRAHLSALASEVRNTAIVSQTSSRSRMTFFASNLTSNEAIDKPSDYSQTDFNYRKE